MKRYEKTTIIFDYNKMSISDFKDLFEMVDAGKMEIVAGQGLKAWCKDEAEDLALELFRADKCDITDNFPVRYAESKGKLITITKENVKQYGTIVKEMPEKFKPKELEDDR
jgi:hypothetical protein